MKSETLAAKATEFVIAADVQDFVRRHKLEAEFARIKNQIARDFNNPEKITVELFASPEDDGDGEERIVFTVKSGMDRQAFKRAIQDFFAPLRTSNSRLYLLVGVLREF